MKQFILILLVTAFSSSLYSQRSQGSSIGVIKVNWYKKGWFLDGNIGARFMGKTSSDADMFPGLSMNGGIGYVFNEYIGIKGRMDYNGFKVSSVLSDTDNKSHSLSFSTEAVVKLLQLVGPTKARDFSLNFHTGIGFTTLFNPDFRKYYMDELGREFNDPFIKGSDDIFHVIVGITPQYHLNSKFSINLDISQLIQFKQHRTYDTFNKELANGVTGVMGITVGMSFRL
jgi:hypothetical protein